MLKRFVASFIIVLALLNMASAIVEHSQQQITPTAINDLRALLARRIKDRAPVDIFITPHHLIASGTIQQVGSDFFCLDAVEGIAQCFKIVNIESVTVNMNPQR